MSEKTVVQSVTTDQFEAIIRDNEIVFIDFWAAWCAPCRSFAHVYEKVAELFENVLFVKVNTAEEIELAETFQIRSIPHIVVFKQGIVIYSEPGSLPESTLKELVQQAIDTDVSHVRAELEKKEE